MSQGVASAALGAGIRLWSDLETLCVSPELHGTAILPLHTTA